MELTPRVFRDVQFREKMRGGYHPEDVDEFLEQAALGAEALFEQLRQANDRAQRAERAASEASSADDALKRLLVMAQRTADQAVKEAGEEAERLISDARAQAQAMLADAETRGRSSFEAAVEERRIVMETADAALAQSQREVEALREWVGTQRAHLLGVMREAEEIIERAGLLSEPPPASAPGSLWPAKEGEAGLGEDDVASSGVDDIASRDDDGGEPERWDPHYLDNLPDGGAATGGGHTPAHGGAAVFSHGGEQQVNQAPYGNTQDTGTGPQASRSGQDSTLAFDERALDSFFSDQDLGDDRGLGRFRRKQ